MLISLRKGRTVDDAQFASTNLLLLERLRISPRDESAWNELVRGYAPRHSTLVPGLEAARRRRGRRHPDRLGEAFSSHGDVSL